MGSPTSRSLKYLRDMGYEAQVVEKYSAFSHKYTDLFGIIDIVAVRPPDKSPHRKGEIAGIQTTSAGHIAARIKKAQEEPRLVTWLLAGGTFYVHGWSKKGKKGARKLWMVSTRQLALDSGNQIVEI